LEVHAQPALIERVMAQGYDMSRVMIGSTNLRRAGWVNTYAKALQVPIAFIREREREDQDIAFRSDAAGIVGDVAGYHVLIYDDIIRSGRTIIQAAEKYLEAGATGVDVLTSHLACFEEEQLTALLDSRIGRIFATNSHPIVQSEVIRGHPEFFHIIDVAGIFVVCLCEILRSTNGPMSPMV
jgi:ribose-phosphate pyrophosphokinase